MIPLAAVATGSSGHAEPVARLHGGTDRFRVFVSYSRADAPLADEIEAGLEYDGGFEVLIDRHDIHEGEEWRRRLIALIAQADTVVFILSRKSVASPTCLWEVEQAQALSKRIIPVQAEALGELEPPAALAALNYVRFDEGRSFMAGLTGLRRALKTDIIWLREHTRLLTRAQEWQAADRPDNRLLSGSDIAAAKRWLDGSPAEGLQPTELHRDFIQASDRAETVRLSAERERAEKLQRAVIRTRRALGIAVVFAAVALAVGWYATQQRWAAESAKRDAQEQERRAKEAGAQALAASALARAESERADRFVTLVSSNPAGKRAMDKICVEAIQATSTLATTLDANGWAQARERFWELYYAPMYIVELHERKNSGDDVSRIEGSMVRFGRMLQTVESSASPLPHGGLCEQAKEVWAGCVQHLGLTAPEPCR